VPLVTREFGRTDKTYKDIRKQETVPLFSLSLFPFSFFLSASSMPVKNGFLIDRFQNI